MALMFDYAPKLVESRKVGLPLKVPFLFFAFNLMLAAALLGQSLRSTKLVFIKKFLKRLEINNQLNHK